MATRTDYYSLQGRVSFALRQDNGKPGAVRWAQNVPKMDLAVEVNEDSTKESHSGSRLKDLIFAIEKSMTTAYTINGLTLENLMAAFWATKFSVNSGSASAEVLPEDLAVGDYFKLDFENTSAWSLVDSTGTPVALVEGTHYAITSAFAGIGEILSLAGLTQPIKASYSYAASNALSLLGTRPDELFLMFDGIDTISNRHVYLEIPRHAAKPTSGFSLINNDGKGAMEFSGEALYDGTDANYPLGKLVLAAA